MGVRTPLELIEIYWEQVYNNMEVELVREVCADPILRHDPDYVTPLSHDDQIERILRTKPLKPLFTHQVLHADATYVTSVWNMESRDGRGIKLCGIEVFKAEDGRFTACWNSTYMKGFWAEDGDLFDPATLTAPALVASPAEITSDWVMRALAAGGAVQAQRIVTDPVVTPIGHGTTSTTVHVRVAYNSGRLTAPRTLVCKIGQRPASNRVSVGPFERERRAYHLFGSEPSFRAPRLYYGASDASTGLCNLVLEDLTETARPGDQITGCSIAEAGAVVRELARFHRAFAGQPGLYELDWLNRRTPLIPAYRKGATVLREWLGDRIGSQAPTMIDDFAGLVERWIEAPALFPTLIHGDPRVDNILFEKSEHGDRACLIDWQSLSSGDPQYDVAYFLSGSLSAEDRRACEKDLIDEHTRLLVEAVPGYSAEAALASYRRNVVSGLWLTVVAAAHVERNNHNARLLETLVGRNVAAVNDWDGLAAIA